MATDITGTMHAAMDLLIAEVNLLRADLTALRTAFSGHVHGGVTAGGANTSAVAAPPAITSQGLTKSGPK